MTRSFQGPVLDDGLGSDRAWFKNLPIQFNPDYMVLWDDFIRVDDDQTNDWTVVKDSGASVGIAADELGGILDLSSAATTDGDGASIQGNEVFQAVAGKGLWFEARVRLHDANDQDFFVGLCENFATNPEACLTASNRIGFQVTEGDAALLCITEASDAQTSTASGEDAADLTYVTLGFHLYSTTHVHFYVNRIFKQTLTTDIPTALMTPAAMSVSGSNSGTFVSSLDYIGVWAER